MPLLSLAPPKARIQQFNLTVSNGARYLQPCSRTLPIVLAALCYIIYARLSGWTFQDRQCLLYTMALSLLLPIGVIEINLIFPVNDRVAELGETLDGDASTENDAAVDKELTALFDKWQLRNWARAGPALSASVLLAFAGHP